MRRQKILYLPVEISTRELDSKLLIAIEAALKGFTVVIGSVQVLKLASILKGGVVFYKDASAPMEGVFARFKSHDVKVVVHDEEGFVHLDDNVYMDARLRFNTIQHVDLFFTWGKHQADMVKKVAKEFSSSTQVIITGHPRIDFLRTPFNETKSLLNYSMQSDRIILINTKLAEYNHRMGSDGWMSILESHSMIRDDKDRALRLEQKEYKKKLFFEYQKLIQTLSKEFKGYKIVIRPHPVENKHVWVEFSKNFDNVEVAWQGSISEWIKNSRVIIHTGCTTGLEAAIMNKPVISYKPIPSSKFDIKLPDSVSKLAYSIDEVVELIKAKSLHMTYSEVLEVLSSHIHNLQGTFSYQDIVMHLSNIGSIKLKEFKLSAFFLKIIFYGMDVMRKFKRLLQKIERDDPKFSTSIEEIKDKKNSFLKLMNIESGVVEVNQFSEEIYVLKKNDQCSHSAL